MSDTTTASELTMRRKPYTQIGIRRLKCVRCNKNRAEHQWDCCALGNLNMPICVPCDIALNRIVLEWLNVSDVDDIMARYEAKLGREPEEPPFNSGGIPCPPTW